MEAEKKKCFVMMPISDADGYEKGHFTRVYEHLIKPAVIEAGFEPVRGDDTSKANFIVIDILQQILECDMAICDLSSRNPNVFYELGIRQAFNFKTVLIKDNKTAMPFDISGIRTLPYNENLRIDEVKKAIPDMAKCILETNESDVKDVNSLLQLLSIEKPAVIPSKVEISQDTTVLLNYLRRIDDRISSLNNNKDYLVLSDGRRFCKGEKIFANNEIVGDLIDFGSDYAILRTPENRRRTIKLNSEIVMQWDDPLLS